MYMQILQLVVHGHVPTRTANNYCMHHCLSNLKKFTISYQVPKIWNSLPVVTNSVMFSQFLEKTARVFSKIITELAKLNTVALSM